MKKLAVSILILMLVSTTVVLAIHEVFNAGQPPFEGYSGERARIRRLYDPFSRDRNFGDDSYKPYSNYGQKGPTYRATNTGFKSAYSGVFNLDTNAFRPQGRNPGRISNWDPRMRGYNTVDVSVNLLPFYPVEQVISPLETYMRGTARIVGRGDFYGAGLNNPFPRTQVFIEAINLPPIEPNQAYEAWLVDEDSGYAMNLGVLEVVTELTVGLVYENRFFANYFESVMITKEAFPDSDPSPGEIVLLGELPVVREIETPTSFVFQRLR